MIISAVRFNSHYQALPTTSRGPWLYLLNAIERDIYRLNWADVLVSDDWNFISLWDWYYGLKSSHHFLDIWLRWWLCISTILLVHRGRFMPSPNFLRASLPECHMTVYIWIISAMFFFANISISPDSFSYDTLFLSRRSRHRSPFRLIFTPFRSPPMLLILLNAPILDAFDFIIPRYHYLRYFDDSALIWCAAMSVTTTRLSPWYARCWLIYFAILCRRSVTFLSPLEYLSAQGRLATFSIIPERALPLRLISTASTWRTRRCLAFVANYITYGAAFYVSHSRASTPQRPSCSATRLGDAYSCRHAIAPTTIHSTTTATTSGDSVLSYRL